MAFPRVFVQCHCGWAARQAQRPVLSGTSDRGELARLAPAHGSLGRYRRGARAVTLVGLSWPQARGEFLRSGHRCHDAIADDRAPPKQ
jgi:hypothetical protein